MSSSNVDPLTHVATAGDLEYRCAQIADPSIDLKTKNEVATNLRDFLDTTREIETVRVLQYLIPTLLELLRTGEPSFRKDSQEYQFRRVLVEILHRIPTSDATRPHLDDIFKLLFHLIRHDNEENTSLACKTMIDLVRNYRCLTEERLGECTNLFLEGLGHMSELCIQLLSEDSEVMDSNVALPGLRSFKVMAELGLVMVMFTRAMRQLTPAVKATIDPTFAVVEMDSPAQKKAREDYEAMGNTWAGMASTVKNATAYSDFVNAQIKLLSYLVYILRQVTDQSAVEYGERLTLIALRLLQDCPATSISLRKDLMVVFRHLIGTPHRRVLVPQIDKLFD
ncbi:transcription-associated protein 1, partial [Marasmius crinis-equi]